MCRTAAMITALALGAGVLTGCSERVSGSPVTDVGAAGTVSITGGGNVITPAALSTVTCTGDVSGLHAACDTTSVTARDIPDGSVIRLRAGDPIRYVGGNAGMGTPSGSDRICTIGAFATDGTDTWALSGSSCVGSVPGGTNRVSGRTPTNAGALTVDGYSLGTTAAILMSPTGVGDGPGGLWTVPAVKLARNVRAVSDISGTASPAAGVSVSVHGAASGDISGYTMRPTRGLTWDGTGTKPTVKAGDQGASVIVDGKLLGFISGQSTMALPVTPPADKLVAALSQLSPNAKLLTK